MSPESLDPKVWGSSLWKTMKAIALVYDPSDDASREYTEMFYASLSGTLPCYDCRDHYCDYFDVRPVGAEMQNQTTLLRWIYDLETLVRKRTSNSPMLPFQEYVNETKKSLPRLQKNPPAPLIQTPPLPAPPITKPITTPTPRHAPPTPTPPPPPPIPLTTPPPPPIPLTTPTPPFSKPTNRQAPLPVPSTKSFQSKPTTFLPPFVYTR